MDIKRKDAAQLLEDIMLLLAHENKEGVKTVPLAHLHQLLEDAGLTLPTPCDGEAHLNAHIDHCGKCLKGPYWGWVGEYVKVK
jgi:hypothetical protein